MPDQRVYLFLQGPHGPFFARLAAALGRAGCRSLRLGFNGGDRFFWHDRGSYRRFAGPAGNYPSVLAALCRDEGVTDLVLYGDARPVHAQALAFATSAGINTHCFEEGYLRPYWITYERGGTNGHSRLMQISVDRMRDALAGRHRDLPDAPPTWGALIRHTFYGAVYHANVLARSRAYPDYVPHRGIGVATELRLQLWRLARLPLHIAQRRIAAFRLWRSGAPYHLVLLQLAHDASMRAHGGDLTLAGFVDLCCGGLAQGAPPHHALVFKTHPLEDDREPLRRILRQAAARHGLSGRVHLIRGGPLAPLLNRARSAITINSTAGQQALWRGLPLKALGRAVYSKPEFVIDQPLAAFFDDPVRPDAAAYRDYRQFLLETSQVSGSYYTASGRAEILRQIVDLMLAPEDPYESYLGRPETPRQHLRAIS